MNLNLKNHNDNYIRHIIYLGIIFSNFSEHMDKELGSDSQSSESSTIILNDEIKLFKYYMLFILEILVFFILAIIIEPEGFEICWFYFLVIIFTVIAVSGKLGEKFTKGVFGPVILAIPLSIISYFNEVKNSCFCPFWCTCPEPPGYYNLPRMIALLSSIIILFWSISEQANGDKRFGFGLFVGLLCSAIMFISATLFGFW